MDIRILDILGHVVWQDVMETGTRNWLIDVSGMPAGMYLLQLSHEGHNKVGKFFVSSR